MMIDLALRQRGLLAHQRRQRAVLARGGIGQDAQGRLDRVRQVAGLRARALDHVGVDRQHAVEVLDQRLDFAGKTSLDRGDATGALRRQLRAQPRQRPQPHQHLHHGRRRQAAASAPSAISSMWLKRPTGSASAAVSAATASRSAPDSDSSGERARQRREPVPLGTGDVVGAIDRPVGQGQRLVPQRPRARGPGHHRAPLVVQAVDLPIQPGQRLSQPGSLSGVTLSAPSARH